MKELRFSAEELQALALRLQPIGNGFSWRRATGARGQDVIEIDTPGGNIRVAKAEYGCYSAIGLKGWSLAIFSGLDDLLDMIKAPRPMENWAGNGDGVLTAA